MSTTTALPSLTESQHAILSKTTHQLDAILADLEQAGFDPEFESGRSFIRKDFFKFQLWLEKDPELVGLVDKTKQLAHVMYRTVYTMFRHEAAQPRPSSSTKSRLARVGVDLIDDHVCLTLVCQKCGQRWYANQPPHGKRFSRGYWHCPNGCNKPERRTTV